MHLSPKEVKVLTKLAQGKSYAAIAEEVGISAPHLHVLCHSIRFKTKIKSTRDPQECEAWLTGQPPIPRSAFIPAAQMPTASQLRILRLVVEGLTYDEIAARLNLTRGSAENAASQGCKRAGITNQGTARTAAIRQFLAMHKLTGTPLDDPMFN